ncbi:MAG: glutamine--fructose-6-phosphate aminotransferase, partial [Clostridia bacterium]|nr:glutamine--fructose-6-phosphate aminotransferase [Clostridia bacterium]
MCGIVGFVGKKHAAPILLEGLLKLEYRGYDSAGIAVLEDNKISVSKTTQRIKDLYDKTNNGKDMSCNIGIGHTRWATHGAPTEFNAHPHLNEDKKFAVVHNGIIENYISIKEQLIKDGVTFVSETDT